MVVRRGDGESSSVVEFPHRSWCGARRAFHAGDCLAGGQGRGAGQPRQPGWGAGGRRGCQFLLRRAVAKLLDEAREHFAQLRAQVDSAEYQAQSARRRAARKRAATERLERLEQAITQLPELRRKQAEAARRAGNGERGEQIRRRQPRVSTTDPQARVMKMPNGGFNPAVNVQLATDTESRAILGVQVTSEGSDSAGLSEPMRRQVEQRSGGKVEQHLLDGGYLRTADIEQAQADGVELFIPPKMAESPLRRGRELEPKKGDSEAVLAWKRRMSSEAGKETYKQRAATSETVNADLRSYRGLGQITVRGLAKAQCVALWCALAYNILHFAAMLLG